MNKLFLKNVTLVAVSSVKIEETLDALKKSMINIDYFEVIFISHEMPDELPNGVKFKKCEIISSIEKYNYFMLYKLVNFIDSDFALVVQYDGYVLNHKQWNNSFLEYDYIGAPWRKNIYFTESGQNVRVGNGGFSLRSKKLLNSFKDLGLSFANKNTENYNEDGVICIYFREILESHGLNFAPVKIASLFSCEEFLDDSNLDTFGFHLYKTNTANNFKRFLKKIFALVGFKFHRKFKKELLTTKIKEA